jgi:hypothetical protein
MKVSGFTIICKFPLAYTVNYAFVDSARVVAYEAIALDQVMQNLLEFDAIKFGTKDLPVNYISANGNPNLLPEPLPELSRKTQAIYTETLNS